MSYSITFKQLRIVLKTLAGSLLLLAVAIHVSNKQDKISTVSFLHLVQDTVFHSEDLKFRPILIELGNSRINYIEQPDSLLIKFKEIQNGDSMHYLIRLSDKGIQYFLNTNLQQELNMTIFFANSDTSNYIYHILKRIPFYRKKYAYTIKIINNHSLCESFAKIVYTTIVDSIIQQTKHTYMHKDTVNIIELFQKLRTNTLDKYNWDSSLYLTSCDIIQYLTYLEKNLENQKNIYYKDRKYNLHAQYTEIAKVNQELLRDLYSKASDMIHVEYSVTGYSNLKQIHQDSIEHYSSDSLGYPVLPELKIYNPYYFPDHCEKSGRPIKLFDRMENAIPVTIIDSNCKLRAARAFSIACYIYQTTFRNFPQVEIFYQTGPEGTNESEKEKRVELQMIIYRVSQKP